LLFFIILANWADFRSSCFLNIDLLKALFLQLPTAIRVIQSLKENDNIGKNELAELNSQASPSDVNVLDQLSEINLGDEQDTPKAKVVKAVVKGKRKRSVLQEEEETEDDDEEEIVKRPAKLKKTVAKKAVGKTTRSALLVEELDENEDDDDEEIVKKSSKTKKVAPKKNPTVKSTRKKKVVEIEEGK
jgi:23S rRNA maturation mini-RNase III